jgi:hypothetical protein
LWYLDDGNIGGQTSDVLRAIEILQSQGPPHGFYVNFAKCELHSHPSARMAAHDLRDAAAMLGMEIPTAQVCTTGNMTMLGAPIGTDAHCAAFVSQCVARAERSLEALRKVRDPQVALTLLRNCSGFCTFVHALRTTPPSIPLLHTTTRFDNAVLRTFDSFFGPLPAACHSQVRRAVRIGGVGIRAATDHHNAAYYSSVQTCARLDKWDPLHATSVTATQSALAITLSTAIDKLPTAQKELSNRIEELLFEEALAQATVVDAARQLAQSGPQAAAWLSVLPNREAGFAFTPTEFTLLVRWWLGQPVFSSVAPCRQCGDANNDEHGYHALVCRCWGGRIYRHHALANVLTTFLKCAHHNPQREKSFDGSTRPADVYLPHWELGKPLALDLAVTHPLQPNALSSAGISEPGSWASVYAKTHKAKQGPPLEALGVDFAPLVVETLGSWDPPAFELLNRFADQYAMHQGIPPALAAKTLFQRLSVTLMRVNVRMILARQSSTPEEHDAAPQAVADADVVWSDVMDIDHPGETTDSTGRPSAASMDDDVVVLSEEAATM